MSKSNSMPPNVSGGGAKNRTGQFAHKKRATPNDMGNVKTGEPAPLPPQKNKTGSGIAGRAVGGAGRGGIPKVGRK